MYLCYKYNRMNNKIFLFIQYVLLHFLGENGKTSSEKKKQHKTSKCWRACSCIFSKDDGYQTAMVFTSINTFQSNNPILKKIFMST